VLRQGIRIVGLGGVLGLGGAVLGGRFVDDLLYQTRPFEPSVAIAVTMAVGLLAMGAMIAPALRAGRADPAVTLRAE
jgi:hypothetical protein